jgi:hypothetical protein
LRAVQGWGQRHAERKVTLGGVLVQCYDSGEGTRRMAAVKMEAMPKVMQTIANLQPIVVRNADKEVQVAVNR